ncbi:unnamed protein product [Spirodela intermedia]|uniref:Uncharacterized protein n=1 Tax=Spirodela intermedia TaxID=51605 RepID=A0A7I8K682_SPIIN|nr:unnamed protein product [Spirodela intermedia]
MSYSIEIKDAVLPPWVVSGLCAAMGARGSSFQSSFTTEPMSMGLNVALNSIFGKSTSSSAPDECTPLSGSTLGFPEAWLALVRQMIVLVCRPVPQFALSLSLSLSTLKCRNPAL